MSIVGLLIFAGIATLQRMKQGRDFLVERGREIFIFSVLLIFLINFYFTYVQYSLWSLGGIQKFLLPPHQPIDYFIYYSFSRFFAPFLISLMASLSLFFIMRIYNRKYGEQFFEKEEPYLAAISIFLVSHPGWLLYLISLIGAYLLFHLISHASKRARGGRLPLYPLWVPVGIFVILITEYVLSDVAFWLRLGI